MAQAVVRLECVDLKSNHLTPDQLEILFNTIATCENLKLISLKLIILLQRFPLYRVPPDVLVRAISRLERIRLSFPMSEAQITAIFTLVAERTPSKLRVIEVTHNHSGFVSNALKSKARENPSVRFNWIDPDYSDSE